MFSWDDSLLTGVEELDNQHIEMCKMTNELFELLNDGKLADEVESALEFFEDYTLNHLEVEEEYMLSIEYPDYIEHKQKHEEFKRTMKEFRESLLEKGITPAFIEKFKYAAAHWYILHLRAYDANIAEFAQNNKLLLKEDPDADFECVI